jgi:predicted FMN-binding regulatory protein PaiB
MSDGVMERMMHGIRPFRLEVSAADSTVKLNQNMDAAAREGAAAEMAARPDAGSQAIAALMRGDGKRGS